MVGIRKEASGVWGEVKGVLLEVIKLPVHIKTALAPPSSPPAVDCKSPILVGDIPSLGCKFDAIWATVVKA